MRQTIDVSQEISVPVGEAIKHVFNYSYFVFLIVTKCSIKGQVFQQCRTCPATCSNPNLICTADCRPGCGCPPGQLIDEQNKRCVPANRCPSKL